MFEFMLTEKQRALALAARRFVAEDVDPRLIVDMDADRVAYPREYVERLARAKLLGLRFPEAYGGQGLGWTEEVAVLEEVGVLGSSLGCLYSLPTIVGEALAVFGTTAQKEKYLAPTIAGKLMCAEALTEPRGGSDFFGATTIARREGDCYYVTGQKRFIVGAEGADYFLVYARTAPGADPHRSISALLVDRGPGVRVERLYGLMGTRGGGTGRVVFRDAKVPAENLLGEEHGASEIFYRMMVPERLSTAAASIGMARAALAVAARYSDKRKAFGRKIRQFQAVSFKIADSLTRIDAARGLVYATARALDAGVAPSLGRRMVSESKKFATETAWAVVNHAMQILGGIGYTNIYPIERMLRDIRLIMIWTGTNEIMDLIIQHELFADADETHEPPGARDVERDAAGAGYVEEKVFE